MVGKPMPKNFQVMERYPLTPPFAYAVIAEDTSQKLPYYYVDELELTRKELKTLQQHLSVLQTELRAPREDVIRRNILQSKQE